MTMRLRTSAALGAAIFVLGTRFAGRAAAQTIAGDATGTCPCGAVVNCRGQTPAACEALCGPACAGRQGGAAAGFNPAQQATLQGANAVGAAIGTALVNGLLAPPRPAPRPAGPSPAERQARRQAREAKQAAQSQAFQDQKRQLQSELKDTSCFCPYGTPEVKAGRCTCAHNAPTESLDEVFARNEKLFRTRAGWDHYRRRSLQYQKELTRDDPVNADDEKWCRDHQPLDNAANDEKKAWMARCGPEGAPRPAPVVLEPAQAPRQLGGAKPPEAPVEPPAQDLPLH